MPRAAPSARSVYRTFVPIVPRWNEIDVFGHVNNAEFYTWFDTAVLTMLHRIGAVEGSEDRYATLVVESRAQFHAEVVFTDTIDVGVTIQRIGTSSVTYGLGVFTNSAQAAAVDGGFTHVFADRASRRPVAIPNPVRHVFESMMPHEVSP